MKSRAGALGISAVALACAAFGETPRDIARFPFSTDPASRDWSTLRIRRDEIRVLEKFDEGPTHEAFHIAYKSGDLHITGVMARPRLAAGRRYPVMMTNHGAAAGVNGPFRGIAIEFARRGYVALASTYRGEENAEGRSEGRVEIAKGEVDDVLQLMHLAKKLPYADPARIGIMGVSHGGSITIQALQRDGSFRAGAACVPLVISAAAEHDKGARASLRKLLSTYLKQEPSEEMLDAELKARDMYGPLNRMQAPLLLITTDTDPGYEGQKHFAEILKQRGIAHRFLVYPGLFHAFLTMTPEAMAARRIEAGNRRHEGGPEALTGLTNAEKRVLADRSRDEAWREIFGFLDKYVRQ